MHKQGAVIAPCNWLPDPIPGLLSISAPTCVLVEESSVRRALGVQHHPTLPWVNTLVSFSSAFGGMWLGMRQRPGTFIRQTVPGSQPLLQRPFPGPRLNKSGACAEACSAWSASLDLPFQDECRRGLGMRQKPGTVRSLFLCPVSPHSCPLPCP